MQVSRRTFTKVAGAIATSLVLPIQKLHGIDVSLISQFCGDDKTTWSPTRYDMSHPFVQREACYATDGRVCLKLFDAKRYAGDGKGKRPDADSVFSHWHRSVGQWERWPKADYGRNSESMTICPYHPMQWEACKICDGNAWVDRKPCICDEDGEVLVRCPNCERPEQRVTHQEICGGHFSPRYHHLISQLPGVEFLPLDYSDESEHKVPYAHNRATRPLVFRFDGGHGLLVGMKKNLKCRSAV